VTHATIRSTRDRPVSTGDPGDGALADTIIALVRGGHGFRAWLRRAARTVRSVVTPLGWVFLAVTVAAFPAGYLLGWVELAAIAWALTVLIAVAAAYLLGRSAYAVRLDLPVSRVVVGDRAPGGVVIENRTRRRLPGVAVEVPVGAALADFAMPALAAGESHDEIFVVPTSRRGVIVVGPVRTVRADPIGLVRRELVWSGQVPLFVHPRTIPIPSMSTGFVRDLEGSPTRDLTSSDVSFHALREYVAGDERRHIHWKSTAKTGTFMVRQFEQTRRSHLMVVLDIDQAAYPEDDAFELAVSAAGSLGTRAIRDARTVSVVVAERVPESTRRRAPAVRELPTVTRERLLDQLCLVETDERAMRLADTAGIAADGVAGISLAFLVTGPSTGISRLRAAAAAFPLGVDVVAVVCSPEATPSLRHVGGLHVLTIGYLEDLQSILASSAAVG
jgi:uncharacterized protein (DUF58 family)